MSDEYYIRRPGDRWERLEGPRTDALALADAISAVVRAAEAMYDAGDLNGPPERVTTNALTPADARRERLLAAIRAVRAVRAASRENK